MLHCSFREDYSLLHQIGARELPATFADEYFWADSPAPS